MRAVRSDPDGNCWVQVVATLLLGGLIVCGLAGASLAGGNFFKKAGKVVTDTTKAAVAPEIAGAKIISGQQSPRAATQGAIQAQGAPLIDMGQAVSRVNAISNNSEEDAVRDIAGKRAGAVLSIGVNANRVTTEFLATSLTGAGEVIQGQDPRILIAGPLAAAMRAAYEQLISQSSPIPPDVMGNLEEDIDPGLLSRARWMVGSVNLDLPDLTNAFVRRFQGGDNATTVFNLTVFATYPGNNYHWWAHELFHQWQYQTWGIDTFALNYVTGCSQVEWSAENAAQSLFSYQVVDFHPPCPD
jgi:hypothetical protein